jgi:folate-binding protein YgfZ
MRLSLTKAAHAVISSATYRKSGSALRCTALALLQGYNFIVLSAMNQPQPNPVADPLTAPGAAQESGPNPVDTVLFAALRPQEALLEPALHCGTLTPRVFDGLAGEMDSLLHSAGVSDLGWRGKILVTGSDRLRWLNGMVSNTVQSLPEGEGNYSFLLSVQGRIQGDCYVYQRSGDLLLDTGFDQIPTLLRHLDHFIIMDDVELADVSRQWTGFSLAGPGAARVLATLGFSPTAPGVEHPRPENARLTAARIGEVPCTIIEAYHVAIPRFELWFAPEHVLSVWETLQAAGATPCGLDAMETLRVLEGTPLYGIDLNDRDLPQETAQARALNFSKGCYLGQEIVERIRSRGKVNRQFRQFALHGERPPQLPMELRSGEQSVGRITSTASLSTAGMPQMLPGFPAELRGVVEHHAAFLTESRTGGRVQGSVQEIRVALGFIRIEVVERNAEITYDGGVATALAAPPVIPGTSPS